jgi:hypothetical protein
VTYIGGNSQRPDIKIYDLNPADSELLKDSGSFLKDLVNTETDVISGGSWLTDVVEKLDHWLHNDDGSNILRHLK